MNPFTRVICAVVVTGGLAGLLGACTGGGDGGGNKSLQLLFGYGDSSIDNDCGFVEITVDAEAADAEFARNGNGNLDCVISTFADQRGCDVTFEELEGGNLHFTAGGCDLSSFTGLFQCGFRRVDLSDLTDFVSVSCDCEDDGCDFHPPACVSGGDRLDDCEVCNNDDDDDEDGETDCDDPNCFASNKCGDGPTSTTSSTTGTDQPRSCDITFRVLGSDTIGSIQWTTDYSNAEGGDFNGSGEDVDCVSLIDGAVVAFNDDDDARTLDSGVVSVAGFEAPAAMVRCTWEGDFFISANDFVVSDIEAVTPDVQPISPQITVGVNCGDGTTTTEEPTTTTEGPTTTTIPGPTTTTIPGVTSTVLFKLDSASATLGALQFGVGYAAAGGNFVGSGANVECTNKVPESLFAPNDVDASHQLTLGIIALSGFSAPIDLVECTFEGPVPEPSDFVVTIEDATNSEGSTATAEISVVVTTED